jgi:Na+-transporting methylmalonyl-CoA/oxaloacetate decarboxylase gamma subunit
MGMRRIRISAGWTGSLTRRLGLAANPLRRGTDRAEAWIRIGLVLVFLAAAPLAVWGVGHWAESVVPTAAQAQQAGEHRVPATLLRDVPGDDDYPSITAVSFGWVRARWKPPGGPVRTGYVEAPAGTRAGSTVQVWLDRAGKPVAPPLLRSQVQGWVFMMAVLAPVFLGLLLMIVMGILGRVLERRRLANWERSWSAVEPQWTRRLR